MTLTEQLLQAAIGAPDELKRQALQVLQGTATLAPKAKPTTPEPYITLRATAKHFGVSTCTLWRWNIPGHELGGRKRYRLAEVQAYIDSDEFKKHAQSLREQRATI